MSNSFTFIQFLNYKDTRIPMPFVRSISKGSFLETRIFCIQKIQYAANISRHEIPSQITVNNAHNISITNWKKTFIALSLLRIITTFAS